MTCQWCGNDSGLKDARGGCISCGGFGRTEPTRVSVTKFKGTEWESLSWKWYGGYGTVSETWITAAAS